MSFNTGKTFAVGVVGGYQFEVALRNIWYVACGEPNIKLRW